MISEKLVGEDLLELQNEKGNICISVIVPTHRLSPERRVDKLNIKRAIEKAEQLLELKYSEEIIKPLMKKIDELFQHIDFEHNTEGLGLYVSSNIELSVQLPFPVEEKVIVGDSFEIRDLLYKVNYSNPYYVLLLTEKGARLFEGTWKKMNEIKDKNFPKEYEEEYSYNPPSNIATHSGYAHTKGFEKDKSELEEIRFKNFFHQIDKRLNDYLAGNEALIVLGVKKELGYVEHISKHVKLIAAKIPGSYSHDNLKQLSDLVWPAMYAYLQNERAKLINEFKEKIGEHLGTSGIQEIWEAAYEGKAFKLLVEKDHRCPGFVDETDYHLSLRPPQRPHKVLVDVVDDLMEMVLEKDGKVFFVDNDLLKDYGRIALITRY
jgi:hypothetical protein